MMRRRSKLFPALADDGPEDRMAEELADLVLDGRDGLRLVLAVSRRRTPASQKPATTRVRDAAVIILPVAGVAEQPLEREERRAGHVEQGPAGRCEGCAPAAAPNCRRRAS